MKNQNPNLRNFLTGALGYTLGAIAGVAFIVLAAWIDVVDWLTGLIDPNQAFWQLLGSIIFAMLFLALAGAIMGGIGGYALRRIMKLEHRSQTIVGSAVAFAISTGLLIPVFLLVIGFIGLYNNFNTDRFQDFGLLFGIFGLVFGLVTGLMQALMSVRLRHSWRLILATPLGFTLGFGLLGLILRLLNPTKPFDVFPILAWTILLLSLLLPFFLGGGFLGFTHGRLARRAEREDDPSDYILPTKWQTYIVAVLGVIIAFSLSGILDNISGFLQINPANLASELTPVTVGVQWSETKEFSGEVAMPEPDQERVSITVEGVDYQAWCSPDGVLHYQAGSDVDEQISDPQCSGLPGLAVDLAGQAHLVWYAQKLADTNGVMRPASALVESIRTSEGWTEAAIAAQTQGAAIPVLELDNQGNLFMVWEDGAQIQYIAVQENYQCSTDELPYLELAGIEAVYAAGLRSADADLPHCRNQYEDIQYTPNPEPEYSDDEPTTNGAFDQVADMVREAQYEVLFVTMQYEPNDTPPSPGSVLAESVADLYQKVKADPEAYPRGMTVRVMLGNYPEMSFWAWGTQIIAAITDFRAAGVEKMVDPEIGWRLEVANFPGTYPHSHTKFVVVDGKTVASAGYNYGYLHFGKDHPSGKGFDMLDLGIQITGPVAQEAISAFDDLWSDADQIHCEDFHPVDGSDWQDTCEDVKAVSDHVPEVLRAYLPPGAEGTAFSLYHSSEYLEGDEFIAGSLAAAEETIDMIHVNFALEVYCMANIIFPGLCGIDQAFPWMHAIIDAIETNQVHVRVIVENANSNGLENRVAGMVLKEELESRGLDGFVEIRFFNGKLHAKATEIDNKLLIIGSQNMHYSAWGKGSLTEHSLTTNDPAAIEEFNGLFEAKWEDAIRFEDSEFGTSQ
jgi:phosphatidylserine/phosphatidylglycerophosphate/cardiolipin synthase-like enzyme